MKKQAKGKAAKKRRVGRPKSETFETILLDPSLLEASLFELADGRVALFYEGEDRLLTWKISEDAGRTWSEGRRMLVDGGEAIVGYRASLVRLKSGRVGLVHTATPHRVGRDGPLMFHTSDDECQTWSMGRWIDSRFAVTRNSTARVLSSGRILAPVMKWLSPLAGAESEMEQNSFCYSWVKYSDDEGETWRDSLSEIFVLLDEGRKGAYQYEEPAVEELKDGSILMIGRTDLGRQFVSKSADRGVTWSFPEPTEIASAYAPLHLVRIPKTGNLMIIWNQVSPKEILAGLHRHRLSAAVSTDEGRTWKHHRNLESLDNTARVKPPPVKTYRMANYRYAEVKPRKGRYIGAPTPTRICYPSTAFIGNEVLVCYDYGGPKGHKTKLKILPLEWFYGK